MSKILYKTRKGSKPEGRPRVYFCCHPDDFEAYFNEITDDILRAYDCTIWYESEMNESYSENDIYQVLKDMQLLVIPITSRLLNFANHAKDIELKYAIENHIHVLPLIMEDGLENKYRNNDIFSNMHCLFKNQDDYEDRIQKFLNLIFVSDEYREKVRNAFIAYIFLSYRKKDRYYARKLMEMIHRNNFCRDVAIWYDEFLVPGENFNDAIAEKIEKSNLFAMVVTPNIVGQADNGEDNYIVKIEYPTAIEYGKIILPVEMNDTEEKLLKLVFKDFPEVINSKQYKNLENKLRQHFALLFLEKNECNPQHEFLIGLAYLDGIDVETDYNRAIELIEKSAKSGLPEAIHKMANISINRTGLKKEDKIFWMKKSFFLKNDELKRNLFNLTLINEIKELYFRLSELQAHYNHAMNGYDVFRAGVELIINISGNSELLLDLDLNSREILYYSCRNLIRHRAKDINFDNLTEFRDWIYHFERLQEINEVFINKKYPDDLLPRIYIAMADRLERLNDRIDIKEYLEKAINVLSIIIDIINKKDNYFNKLIYNSNNYKFILDIPAELRELVFSLEERVEAYLLLARVVCDYSQKEALHYCRCALKDANLIRNVPNTVGFYTDLANIYSLLGSLADKNKKHKIAKHMKNNAEMIYNGVMQKKYVVPLACEDEIKELSNCIVE